MASIDWQDILGRYLIGGGTVGRKQSEITKRMQSFATAADILNELEALQALSKVDRYELPSESGKGRKVVLWRATTKIMGK